MGRNSAAGDLGPQSVRSALGLPDGSAAPMWARCAAALPKHHSCDVGHKIGCFRDVEHTIKTEVIRGVIPPDQATAFVAQGVIG